MKEYDIGYENPMSITSKNKDFRILFVQKVRMVFCLKATPT